METGLGQPEYLEQYFRENGGVVHDMTFVGTRDDFSYRKRFVILRKEKKQDKDGKVRTSSDSDIEK